MRGTQTGILPVDRFFVPRPGKRIPRSLRDQDEGGVYLSRAVSLGDPITERHNGASWPHVQVHPRQDTRPSHMPIVGRLRAHCQAGPRDSQAPAGPGIARSNEY